jgi:hypothetical protein
MHLRGIRIDTIGAAIPSTTVTARSQGTVPANAFTTAILPAFTPKVRQTAKFDVTMRAGRASSSRNASAAEPILDTYNITQRNTFTANAAKNRPRNRLDFSALALQTLLPPRPRPAFERSTYCTIPQHERQLCAVAHHLQHLMRGSR